MKQNFARMDRRKLSISHKKFLVVVNNLNIMGVTVLPVKANAPLIVDADAVLAWTTTFELLQPVA